MMTVERLDGGEEASFLRRVHVRLEDPLDIRSVRRFDRAQQDLIH